MVWSFTPVFKARVQCFKFEVAHLFGLQARDTMIHLKFGVLTSLLWRDIHFGSSTTTSWDFLQEIQCLYHNSALKRHTSLISKHYISSRDATVCENQFEEQHQATLVIWFISQWLKRGTVVDSFKCHNSCDWYVDSNQYVTSLVMIRHGELYLKRRSSSLGGHSYSHIFD